MPVWSEYEVDLLYEAAGKHVKLGCMIDEYIKLCPNTKRTHDAISGKLRYEGLVAPTRVRVRKDADTYIKFDGKFMLKFEKDNIVRNRSFGESILNQLEAIA